MSDAQRLSDCMDELAAREKRMREVAEELGNLIKAADADLDYYLSGMVDTSHLRPLYAKLLEGMPGFESAISE